MNKVLAIFLAILVNTTVSAAPTETAKVEIDYLLTYLKSSGCKFNRNGTWYSAEKAARHLQKKYNYLLEKNLTTTAESFIKRGATESSMSSKPYLVQCFGSGTVESATWFMTQLSKFRGKNIK